MPFDDVQSPVKFTARSPKPLGVRVGCGVVKEAMVWVKAVPSVGSEAGELPMSAKLPPPGFQRYFTNELDGIG